MKTCPICFGQIKKHQKIAIIARGIESLDDNGGFDVINDLIDKQWIIHDLCFEKFYKKIDTQKCVDKTKEFKEVLNIIGEKPSEFQVQKFLIFNGNKNLDDLVKIWFMNKEG
jgi:hypothetical protein